MAVSSESRPFLLSTEGRCQSASLNLPTSVDDRFSLLPEQVKYLEVIPLVAAQLIKKGDFLAPSYPEKRYGYGCVLYDHVCDFSTEGAQELPEIMTPYYPLRRLSAWHINNII